MYREAKTLYFTDEGPDNTDAILQAAVERAKELNVRHLLVASNTGETAQRALEFVREIGYAGKLVVVGQHTGFTEKGVQQFDPAARRELESQGIPVVIGTHALSSVSRSFRLKWQGIDMLETIAETFRRFSEGVKVCVETSIMAADAGAIPVGADIVAVGGTTRGADSAVVLTPTNMNRFFDIKMREIIGMPR